MKKKTLTLIGVITIMLIGISTAYAMTGAELQELCDPDDAEIIAQYLDLNADYPVETELSLQSGEEYVIIIVNGIIRILKI